jgi:CDP-paratose 2-epimerase
VRDVLYVSDLVDAMTLAEANIESLSGDAFNIGGGVRNATSLLELLEMIGELVGERPQAMLRPWRRADQRYYVSDTRRFRAATGWMPKVGVQAGLAALLGWFVERRLVPIGVGARQVAS